MGDLFQCGANLFNERHQMEETKVSVTLGYTLNLGNFQSLRLDLGVVDSKRDGENTDQAFERVYKLLKINLLRKLTKQSLK